MSAAPDPHVRSGCPRWVKALLVVSLTANVAVLGLVLGYEFREHDRKRGAGRLVDRIVALVPEERRDLAEAHFAAARTEVEDDRAERWQQISAVVESIRAEPFAPEGLEAALERMTERRLERRQRIRGSLVSLMTEFTPAERAVFADNLQARLEELREKYGDRAND